MSEYKYSHVLDLQIAVNLDELSLPENINGARLVLGADSNEEVVHLYIKNFLDKIKSQVLSTMIGKADIVDAQLSSIDVEELTEEEPEEADVPDRDWKIVEAPTSDEEVDEEIVQETPVPSVEEMPVELSALVNIIDKIANDIFQINAHLGEDIKVHLRDIHMYDQALLDIIGYPVFNLDELGAEDDGSDYIIEYKDIKGVTRYGNRIVNKGDER